MFCVPDNAPPEDKAIAELINQGLDSRQLFKAAFGFHQHLLSRNQADNGGTTIQSGLFKGTTLNPESFSSQFLPKFIGTYECEVQHHLASINSPIDCFLNIGCADGFYLAGMARWRRIPCIGVDIDPRSPAAVANVGKANSVSDLISFSPTLSAATQQLSGKTLILIDVDGAELKVLEELFKLLEENSQIENVHLIVESDINVDQTGMNHSLLIRSLCEKLWSVDQIMRQNASQHFLPEYSHFSFLDQVVLAAEGRYAEQTWIVAKRNYGG